MRDIATLTPQVIITELDKHIVGQTAAKRAVAIALRNRWRRLTLTDPSLREEITPKNILMIGPTGVGKTEIARRLARLVQAPFIKVEATKFTEVGYVGRDVESIIRDLLDMAIKQIREIAMVEVKERAAELAEDRILDILLPRARGEIEADIPMEPNATREKFRQQLRDGKLDEKEIDVELRLPAIGVEIMAPPGMEDMTNQLQGMLQNMRGEQKKSNRLQVAKALTLLIEEEAANLLDEEDIKTRAINAVEENGIVFLDEIDKITSRSSGNSPDVSREGVQRDILPLIEGATVSTRYGMIRTDHILFIASGAFHLAKPSDLIPELQGRLPIRVELCSLTTEDFIRILTEPDASLTEQYSALLAVEDFSLQFREDAIRCIAEIASDVNERTENIGARRLHTILEKLLETLSFEASDRQGEKFVVDASYVHQQLESLVKNDDLSRYIL